MSSQAAVGEGEEAELQRAGDRVVGMEPATCPETRESSERARIGDEGEEAPDQLPGGRGSRGQATEQPR